jgi:hypothetical protein
MENARRLSEQSGAVQLDIATVAMASEAEDDCHKPRVRSP